MATHNQGNNETSNNQRQKKKELGKIKEEKRKLVRTWFQLSVMHKEK